MGATRTGPFHLAASGGATLAMEVETLLRAGPPTGLRRDRGDRAIARSHAEPDAQGPDGSVVSAAEATIESRSIVRNRGPNAGHRKIMTQF